MKYNYLTNNNLIIHDEETFTDYTRHSISDLLSYKTEYYRYDFNNGFRISFTDCSQDYYIVIRDKNTKYQYFRGIISPERNVIYSYEKKYFIEYEISIHMMNNNVPNCYPFEVITFDLYNKDILILISGSEDRCGLGDEISWLQATVHFHNKYPKTNIYICTSYSELNVLIKKFAPYLNIIDYKSIKNKKFYATYLNGCFFNDTNRNYNPIDFRLQSLISMGYNVLGIEEDKQNPALLFKYDTPKKEKPYVCIGVHASGIFKEWLPDEGEYERLVDFLKNLGYDVYIIDKDEESKANNLIRTKIPSNAINLTGYYTLEERAKILSGADFFIGVSSGLSWLAWSVGIPVVLISGFTNPITEFYTPYRVINYNKCNSCWNDYFKENIIENPCPRKCDIYKNDYLECTTSITSLMVIDKICKIPSVREKLNERNQ